MADQREEQQRRLMQTPIPTHPADPAARGEADKVVGDPVPHSKDYNDPPPPGAVKSTGQAIDPDVGGALGQPPSRSAARQGQQARQSQPGRALQRDNSAARQGATGQPPQRSEGLLPAGDDAGAQDDQRFDVAEEVNLDQQSDRSRRVGQLPEGGPGNASGAVSDALRGNRQGNQAPGKPNK